MEPLFYMPPTLFFYLMYRLFYCSNIASNACFPLCNVAIVVPVHIVMYSVLCLLYCSKMTDQNFFNRTSMHGYRMPIYGFMSQ